MADPDAVRAARAAKNEILAMEAAEMREMAKRWLAVEKRLQAQLESLSEEVARLAAAGKDISVGKLYRLDRYQRLLVQVQSEFAQYAEYAEDTITQAQREYVLAAIRHSEEVLGATVTAAFDTLPVEAVEQMVASLAGFADGKVPLGDLLRKRMIQESGVFERLSQTLLDGTALGWHPSKTARKMADDLAEGLNKALLIARTEQIRAYRTAQLESYKRSGIVEGVQRLCAHSPNTCLACLADEGTVYPIETGVPDHPQGRCTGLPVIDGEEYQFRKGESWLRSQPEATQKSIMGVNRWNLWKSGSVEFGDFATVTRNAEWGEGLKTTALKDLGAGGSSTT